MPAQESQQMPHTRTDVQPKKTPKQQRSRQRVAGILQATRSALLKHGATALTTTRVAEEAGIPVSSLYQYFPNKISLLMAIYADYLEDIRDMVEGSDNEPQPTRENWREHMQELLLRVSRQEQRDRIDLELIKAVSIHPELRELDRQHANWIADRLVRYFLELGSSWPRARLKRLMLFAYEINNAAWMARITFGKGHSREIVQWEITAMLALLARCLDET